MKNLQIFVIGKIKENNFLLLKGKIFREL